MPKPSTMVNMRSPPAATPFGKCYKGASDKKKKTPKTKSGNRFHDDHQPHYQKQPNRGPGQAAAALLHRLSLPPSSSPPRGLLERIGGSIRDDEVMTEDTLDVDVRSCASSDESWVLQGKTDRQTDLLVSVTPRHHTPEPGEVDRFLASVMGASPFGHASSVDAQPTLSPVDHPVKREPPTTQLVLNSPMPDLYHRIPPSIESVPPASASAIEECRNRLASVLLVSAHARDPASRLDSEQCLRLLSDDHCRRFIQHAKEMRRQLSLAKTSDKDWIGSVGKRDRVDDVDVWVRNTRTRFGSANTVASDVSRRDSDITLVDFAGGTIVPKAPRAMLQEARHARAHNDTPYVLAAPTMQGQSPVVPALASSTEQAQSAIKTLQYANQPMMDTSSVYPTGDLGRTVSSTISRSADCTRPGTWFKHQGSHYAEIVDVDIVIGDEMFYLSYERQPSRLRMHLRLCSVPVGTAMNDDDGRGAFDRQAFHWPEKGKLVLQANPESARSKTWLPCVLESDPLDVTSCMRPGKNTFRFIQLADLSEFAFVLVASPPPREEEWRSWDWAFSLLVDRSHADFSPVMSNLSEFACLSVNVRS